MVFTGNGEANEHHRCNKTKFILFKYKNPLSNSVQSIKFKSVLTSLQNEYRNRYAGQKRRCGRPKGVLYKIRCSLQKKKNKKVEFKKLWILLTVKDA